MNWPVFWTTFVTIFIAEMGDKTQFAALAASSSTKSTFSVLLAVVLALSIAGALGVWVGHVIGDFVPALYLKWLSGCLFILMGTWILFTAKA